MSAQITWWPRCAKHAAGREAHVARSQHRDPVLQGSSSSDVERAGGRSAAAHPGGWGRQEVVDRRGRRGRRPWRSWSTWSPSGRARRRGAGRRARGPAAPSMGAVPRKMSNIDWAPAAVELQHGHLPDPHAPWREACRCVRVSGSKFLNWVPRSTRSWMDSSRVERDVPLGHAEEVLEDEGVAHTLRNGLAERRLDELLLAGDAADVAGGVLDPGPARGLAGSRSGGSGRRRGPARRRGSRSPGRTGTGPWSGPATGSGSRWAPRRRPRPATRSPGSRPWRSG